MTGCVAQRKDIYYVRLTYYDKDHKRKDKWVSTGLSGRGAKQKAAAMINSFIEKYSYLEKSEHPSKMVDYLKMWKALQESEVAPTTYDGYHTYIDRHLIPYFEMLNLDIQDITAGHIMDYVNYLSKDGGRKDNKIGGQSITSIRKIISILRKVFDYAVVYGDIKINPALQVPLPKREKHSNNMNKNKRQVFLTAEEAQKMLDAFQSEEIGPIIFVTLYYGLRKSEALGLRWQAVDFENNTITINHTVVGGTRIIAKDSTKSYCSTRTYELIPDIKILLLRLKEQQEDYKRRLGVRGRLRYGRRHRSAQCARGHDHRRFLRQQQRRYGQRGPGFGSPHRPAQHSRRYGRFRASHQRRHEKVESCAGYRQFRHPHHFGCPAGLRFG